MGVVATLSIGAAVAAVLTLNPGILDTGGSTGSGEVPEVPEPPTTIEMSVPMYQLWTETGIWCATGDTLDITASGTAFHNSDPSSEVGPDGLSDPYYHQYNVPGLPDTNTASLIGDLGHLDAEPFYVGYGTSYTCPVDGQLYLGINDIDMTGNNGQFSAVITHTPAG